MVNQSERKYLLVIKRDNNDYLPFEWNFLDNQNDKNINSLEEIDTFTKNITRIELLAEALSFNLIDIKEKFTSFAIIYYEKGKTRVLKEGPIFKEDIEILSEQEFISFIIENITNKSIINNIYNICNSKDSEPHLDEFKFILKNLNLFINKGENALIAALSKFNEISYFRRRSIIIRVSRNICLKNKISNQNFKKSKNKVA